MIIVMGLPGAGKTTVLKGLETEYRILNFGDLMFEIEKERFGIEDRDQMRGISKEQQEEVQADVYERLSKDTRKIILDTHCAVKTPGGFFPGVPFKHLQKLKVDALILITADPDEIRKRRMNDSTRIRDSGDVELHDQMNKAYLAAYSAFTGAPAVIIMNEQGKVENAVARLQEVLP